MRTAAKLTASNHRQSAPADQAKRPPPSGLARVLSHPIGSQPTVRIGTGVEPATPDYGLVLCH